MECLFCFNSPYAKFDSCFAKFGPIFAPCALFNVFQWGVDEAWAVPQQRALVWDGP